MKNYAIIIGVSEYSHAQNLPACKNDADTMGALLKTTGKYDVLIINENISKTNLIEKVELFLASEGNSVGEIFFYFSGHGMQDTNTYFILQDTDISKVNSTALKNSEIDDIIRRRNPSLFVKIIDACQSGLEYIKGVSSETEVLNIQLPQHEKSFKNCIFMCSSQKDQSSLATNEYSYFTKSFFASIAEFSKAEKIKYSDIQNYIADDFRNSNINQTPQFILQSDGTDVFTFVHSSVKEFICSFQNNVVETGDMVERADVEDKVNQFLNNYRSEEEVIALMKSATQVMQGFSFPKSWLTNYYQFVFKESSYSHWEEDSILNFLYQRCKSENLYVEIDTNEISRPSLLSALNSINVVPIRFSSKARNLPTFCAYLGDSQKDGLPRYEISFVFIFSDTYFYVLVANKEYRYKGWGHSEDGDATKYVYTKFEYASFTEDTWKKFLEKRIENSKSFIEKSVESFVMQ